MGRILVPMRGGRLRRWISMTNISAPTRPVARLSWLTFFLAALLGTAFARGEEDGLDVLPAELPEGPKSLMLHRYLLRQANAALDAREKAYEKIKTAEDSRVYQEKMRAFFLERLGGFPERTPLEARTLATLERDGYRVETVLFASRPGFHVTGLLFLPESPGPHPGVLVPCGHSGIGAGHAGPAVLHAAALERDLYAQVEVRRTLDTWSSVAGDRQGCGAMLLTAVHGALKVSDLPDLRRVIGEKQLTVVDPRDSQHEPLSSTPTPP